MSWNRRRALIGLGASMAPGAGAWGQPADPAGPVRRLEAALARAGDGPAATADVRAAVERWFDTRAIALQVLAGHAAGATAGQIDRFREALVGAIVRELIKRLRRVEGGALSIGAAKPVRPNEWLVTTRLVRAGEPPQTISWLVREGPDGLRIADVRSGGAGMARALRNEHEPALRRLGLDEVSARMEARNARPPI